MKVNLIFIALYLLVERQRRRLQLLLIQKPPIGQAPNLAWAAWHLRKQELTCWENRRASGMALGKASGMALGGP